MASRTAPAWLFGAGLAARAALVAALALGAGVLAVGFHYFATALILAVAALLVGVSLARAIGEADRRLSRFLGGAAAGFPETGRRGPPGFPALGEEMRLAAEALQRSRAEQQRATQTLEALLDTVGASLLLVRPDGSVELANRAARTLAGQEIAGLAEASAIGSEAAARILALPAGGREVVRLADGRRALVSCALLSTPEGGRRRLVSLQTLAEELAPVELGAWQDLVRILAHEMMNSLTPISSLSESLEGLLAKNAGGGALREAGEAVETIGRRSRSLMHFVDRYRRMAELPSPVPAPVRLADLCGQLETLTRASMQEGGIVLDCAVDPPDLAVTADAELLEQACINLLKNAADAVRGREGPRIALDCRRGGEQVLITIADNGQGLPAEDAERIFTPFYTTKAGGSGIGLSLARQIALAHGGQLTARRNEAGGASFILALPAPAPD